ncbi:hypothetical protein [Streptosporangium sp. NPDC001681]|uniref:hypothetical protein n=1 Tax=Streptosporangium sp. NPDC001681 TaxID=3154395 RepID=UPI00331A7DB3
MTRRDHRSWLISTLSVAVVGWATAAGTALLPVIHDVDMSVNGVLLLLMWVIAIPAPTTAVLIAWQLHSITLKKAYELGQRHAQNLDNIHRKMSHGIAMLS